MNISKKGILMSIVVLLMIASVGVSIAVSVNESNITTENLTIEENQTENQTNLGNTTELINLNIIGNKTEVGGGFTEPIIAYTNPISGVSIFGIDFGQTDIYTSDSVTWDTYTFYLPSASFVSISVFGDVMGFKNQYSVGMVTDDEGAGPGPWIPIHSYGMCNNEANSYCYDNFQMTKLRFLTKGNHTIWISGSAEPAAPSADGNYYWVFGYISVLAFPEYSAITVKYPNGYETWYRGQTKTITWTSTGHPGGCAILSQCNVKIELYKAGVRNAVISSKTPNDGSYSWYVPTYQPIGADYKIKITSYEEPVYYDWSNNNFKIY